MTEQEFIALDSRERDAFLAEKVMGWQVKWVVPKKDRTKGGRAYPWVKYGLGGWSKCPLFTDFFVEDAWILLKHLRDECGVYLDISTYPDHFAVTARDNGGREVACGSHRDVELAIGLASGKAVGAIEEG